MTDYFLQAFIYLAAAVIAVPIAKRLGLGSVLGYLVAGVIIGPLLGVVGDETVTIQHFAEFGVVMMLFLVGLELDPRALWAMKSRLLGLGGLQVGLTLLAVSGLAIAFNQRWSVGIAIGFVLALSSTAIVLQTLREKGLQKTDGGKSAFSVLLFQDIAVIFMLAIIPLLALPDSSAADSGAHNVSLVADLPAWAHALVILVSVAAVISAGHYLSRPLFRFVASSGLKEVFTATALMLVIGIAALMNMVGLSAALGTFLAGVVLANSEFRHELESSVAPFKGLLLGLFFITVGAGINVQVLSHSPWLIVGLTLAIMLVKALILFGIGGFFGVKGSDRWLLTLSLAQAGEFGFVLLSYSEQNQVIPGSLAEILALVVALSMFLTPALFILFDRVILPRFRHQSNQRVADPIDEQGTVIIAGIGRVGQIVNRLLMANGIKTVVLDIRAEQVELMRRINTKAYFGDAAQHDILSTAGIEQAAMLVVAIDNQQAAIEMVRYVKRTYPKVNIMARAFDRGHGYRLRHAGANVSVSETYYSALELGAQALHCSGFSPQEVSRQTTAYQNIEQEQSDTLYRAWVDENAGKHLDNDYLTLFMQLEGLIEQALQQERAAETSASSKKTDPPDFKQP